MSDSTFITDLGLTIGQSIKENTFFDITKSYNINQFVRAIHPTNGFLYFFKSKITGNQGHNPFEDTTNQYWDYVLTDTIKVYNPFSLGMMMRSMTTISHPSWLKSDTTLKDGTIYVSLYEKLVDVNTTGTSGTITIGSTTYNTKEKDGFVVISATDWQTIYSNYGIVAQFGIDTTNQQFYLPYGDESKRVLVEKQESTGDGVMSYNLYSDGWLEIYQNQWSDINNIITINFPYKFKTTNYSILNYNFNYPFTISNQTTSSLTFDPGSGSASKKYSVGIFGYTNQVSNLTNRYYDYYYVGETLQNAGIINIGTALNKINNALYIVKEYHSATYNYEVYSNGTCDQWGYQSYPSNEGNTTIALEVPYIDTTYVPLVNYAGNNSIGSESELCVMENNKQTTSFEVRHGASYSLGLYWRTKGQVDLSMLNYE
jgi:hypothetical protein